MEWKTVEIMGYAYYSKKGYRILVSLADNYGYDFIAEKDGEYVKVNVKLAGLKSANKYPNSWAISNAGRGNWRAKLLETNCDVFLVWLPHQERFIELNGDFFHDSNSKSKLIPKDLLNL